MLNVRYIRVLSLYVYKFDELCVTLFFSKNVYTFFLLVFLKCIIRPAARARASLPEDTNNE